MARGSSLSWRSSQPLRPCLVRLGMGMGAGRASTWSAAASLLAAESRRVLEELLDGRHTRLLAEEFSSRSARVRDLSLRLAAMHPDSDLLKPAESALEVARKAREKAEARGKELPEEERDEAYHAALACASAGSLAGLEELLEEAASSWKQEGPTIRRASEGSRSRESGEALSGALDSGDGKRKLAALHLMAGLGTKENARLVRGFLDVSDNRLKVAAINALRGMYDREPPLEKLPVFEAIDMAEAWKGRL